jgi:hypothetical protein
MAFSLIPASLIQVGKSLKKEIFQIISDNFVEIDTDLNDLKNSQKRITVFDETFYNSTPAPSISNILYYQADQAFTFTSCVIGIFDSAGAPLTGDLEIDIEKASDRSFGSAVSLFTTRPSITLDTASDYDDSTNQVFDANNVDIAAGEWIRVSITELPTGGNLSRFTLNVYGEI